jgi:hypothetical protein
VEIRPERSLWGMGLLTWHRIVHDERDDGRSFERWFGLAGMETTAGMEREILFRDLRV